MQCCSSSASAAGPRLHNALATRRSPVCSPSTSGGSDRQRTVARAMQDDVPPQLLGDWRDFRAKLIAQNESTVPWSMRVNEDNHRLLKIQNPRLASEEIWVHPTGAPEKGGLLIATPNAHQITRNDSTWQAVVFIIQHGADGTIGLVLNRPSRFILGRGRNSTPIPVQGVPQLQDAFADNRLYCGGSVAQSVVHIMHGVRGLPGALEVVPGVYLGGEGAACQEVLSGACGASDFKFFVGAMLWEAGELEAELAAGVWHTAACSRPLILKQCLQLPLPFWREVMELMGGRYGAAAKEVYRNGSDGLE